MSGLTFRSLINLSLLLYMVLKNVLISFFQGQSGGGIVREFGIDTVHTAIFKMDNHQGPPV